MFDVKKCILLLAALLVACSPTPTVTSTSPGVPTLASETPMPQIVIPTRVISPTAIVGEMDLWLQITSPLDEMIVHAPQVDVLGSAPAGTVISVNDEILIVGDDGQFKTTLPLEEGPNLIEIIASNEDGNEIPALLTVTYEP